MREADKLNVAIVGGGRGCRAIMDMLFAKKLDHLQMKLIGVADINPEAVGYRHAQNRGIYTTQDYHELYKAKNVNMIIDLTGRDDVAAEISRTKPDNIRLMDQVIARLFQEIFRIEEERVAERKRVEEALREDGRFLESVFDAIQNGITVLDCEFNIIRVNPWIENTHRSKMPLIGKKCYEAYHNRKAPCPRCPSLRTLGRGDAHSEIVPYPSEQNPTRWMDLSAFPLKNASGRVVGIIAHMKDITSRKQAEEVLKNAHNELARRVEERTAELAKANKQLEKLSVTDELTGLYNRRHLMRTLESEYKRALRHNRNLALLMLDIDHFKQVNDQLGHLCGDRVLQEIARVLKRNVRASDLVARYGGEEIAVILIEAGISAALEVAEKLRQEVETHAFMWDGKSLRVTVSIGAAAHPGKNIQSWKQLLDTADQAMYRAKEAGRNRVAACTVEEKKI
ncbi:MAG TPA: GGDEF domain-containing protein [Desulfobacterales bacterium]|nr:GGDEF domain-containing protein [Desulfobacterales bacterium]